jgi:hypothetical protein
MVKKVLGDFLFLVAERGVVSMAYTQVMKFKAAENVVRWLLSCAL